MVDSAGQMGEISKPVSQRDTWRRPLLAIAVLVCLFAAAMYQRNSIRAYWWASRLAAAEDFKIRAYYLTLLTTVGDSAAGAIHRLAQNSRADVRALAIPAMVRLSAKYKLPELSGLLADGDAEVRDSAATVLAFMANDGATRILIEHARSGRSGEAASSVAALARVSSTDALAALCDVVRSHSDAIVRAQAVEALAAWTMAEAPEGQVESPSSRVVCAPMLVLIGALEDLAPFTGQLALERQVAAVSDVASTSAVRRSDKSTKLHIDSAPPSAHAAQRRVADVAARWLSTLTGKEITAGAGRTSVQQAELADQCRRWMAERRQTSQPASSPAGEAARANSADTPSDADHPG
ncbi:MAG TPA: HEAT repeat domain-containing protein [Phycisphaerae bacterium]|nr:HEAT repeat domain-containing protein [Phycisphaerae bacterium]